jgi:hypothetical protein
MNEITYELQTEYIPGWNVNDNSRTRKLIKKLCKEQKIKCLLVGVDAKKAFDSVDHN